MATAREKRTAARFAKRGLQKVGRDVTVIDREKAERKREEPETIKLKPKEKTGIAAFREKPTIAGKAVKALTSLKTTAGLAATLATGGAGAIARGAAGLIGKRTGTAVITKTAETFGKFGKSLTTQRAFVGRSSQSGIDKIFHSVRPVASRYASNKKSQGLTNSLLKKAGMTAAGLAAVGTLVGTYPFAEFELAEATDKIGIAIFRASGAGDEEEVNRLIGVMDEMLDETVWENIISKIPFANVFQSVRKNIAAAQESAESIRNSVAKQRAELEAGESAFQEERRETDELARQRQLEERDRDAQYFALIREGKFDEAQELLDTELEGGR